jgi:hypothetical protein
MTHNRAANGILPTSRPFIPQMGNLASIFLFGTTYLEMGDMVAEAHFGG